MEFQNGHGTGPVIWGYLCKEYLGMESNAWLFGDNKKLWALINDKNVPRDIRLVHAFTFNDALCPNKRINEMAEACLSAYKKTSIDTSRINHWGDIGKFLKSFKALPKSRGVVLSCTSISDEWISWDRIVKNDGDKSWDIFSEIDA